MANKIGLDLLAAGAANSLQKLLAAQQARQLEEIRAMEALKKMLAEQQFEAQQNALERATKYQIALQHDKTLKEIQAQKNQIDLEKLKAQKERNRLLQQLRKDAQDWENKNKQYQRMLDTIDLLIKARRNNINVGGGGGVPTPEQLVGEGGAPLQQAPQQEDATTKYLQFLLNNLMQEAGLKGLPAAPQPEIPQGAGGGYVPFSIYDPRTRQLIINQNKNRSQQQQQQPAGKQKKSSTKDEFSKKIELLGGFLID